MGSGIGPMPMHDVVVMAVRNAVSAATTTFTSVSMILCVFMVKFTGYSLRVTV